MLTPGNQKLGKHLIWAFSLPSGVPPVCVGMTPACRRVCYAARLESYRPTAAARYAANLRAARRRGFVRCIRAAVIANHVRILRIHAGGEFFSVRYARRWLAIIRRTPRVRFFTYTRVWRVPKFLEVLNVLAKLPNLQLWFSADRDTGWPEDIPDGVRVAWLMAESNDLPPRPADLVFRVRSLRNTPMTTVNASTVCPAEDGIDRNRPMTCDTCRTCWRPATHSNTNPVAPAPAAFTATPRRVSLPLLEVTC